MKTSTPTQGTPGWFSNRALPHVRLSIIACIALVMVGCTSVEYVGDSYSPTDYVDLYYSEAEIERDFYTMGHGLGTGVWTRNSKIQKKIIEEARDRGADAILITGLGKSHIPIGDDGSAEEKQINVSFLKYR